MRVSYFRIKNLFGITEMEGDGKSREFTGDNGTGKTSVIDSFRLALTNKSDRDFVIKKGAEEGEILIETDSGLRIHRKYRTNKSDYKSIKENGVKGEKTEAFLRGIFTELQLNPIEFCSLSKEEQNRIVLNMIEFAWDRNWIIKHFGEDVPGINYEDNILSVLHAIQADEGYYYQKRQDINREARNKAAFVTEIGLKLPTNYNADEWINANVGEIWKKVERIRNENQVIEKAKAIVENRDNKARKFQADYDIEIAAIDRELNGTEKRLEDEVLDLQHRIDKLRIEINGIEDAKISRKELAKATYDKNVAQFDGEVKEHIEDAKKETTSFADLQSKAEHTEAMKAHINQYKDMKKYETEVADLNAKSADITEKIEKARTLPGEILATCNIPVEGLTVVNGIPLIHGLPISNLSEGEKFDLCLDIAMRNEESLNFLLLDGVEKWSETNRVKNYDKLKKSGVHFIASRTTDDKRLKVIDLK